MARATQTNHLSHSGKQFVGVFTLSIFVSACLLFSVQPLFAKMALPLLGGSSNVWNTAMVFFQAMLLGGYIYAHLLTKLLAVRAQFITHLAVLAIGFISLPLSINSAAIPPGGGGMTLWLLVLFTVSIGLPFFALSANAPLLQRWYSYTGGDHASNPYFLYAASNLGSLLALCAYPIVIEPLTTLPTQSKFWTIGYGVFMCLAGTIAIFGYIGNWQKSESSANTDLADKPLSPALRIYWVLLAFIPSSLMLGATSHITTNIASAPFIWIMPLALYLLTFIITFSDRDLISPILIKRFLIPTIICAFIGSFLLHLSVPVMIAITLFCFFTISLVMHAELVAHKPDVSRLTEFYIWMSIGGVLGGVFNALLAPLIFNDTYEYVLVLLLSLFAVAKTGANIPAHVKKIGLYLSLATPIIVLFYVLQKLSLPYKLIVPVTALAVVIAIYGVQKNKGFAIINLVALSFISVFLVFLIERYRAQTVYKVRSFFGVISVVIRETDSGTAHAFIHGDTTHNYQLRQAGLQTLPLAYYSPGNSFETALKAVRRSKSGMNVALIGLGAGAMACYQEPDENWVYFEIDPKVVEMALNPELFSYMSKCAPNADIRIGDARLKLKELENGSQDYIILDAFSSDSIPAHLITQEALELYQRKLKPDGVLFYHTSNRVMDIDSIVQGIVENAGLSARRIKINDFEGLEHKDLHSSSTAILVAPKEVLDAIIGDDPQWKSFETDKRVGVWTDDYSNVLGAIIAKRQQSRKD